MALETKTGEIPSSVLSQSKSGSQAVKAKPGSSWKNDETQVLPKNRLTIVCFPILLNVFSLKVAT
jgi:hypothetical protein